MPPRLPSRRVLGRVAALLAVWTAAGLLIAAQTGLQLRARGESRPLWTVVGPPLVGAWIWVLYTPLVVALARRARSVRERRGWVPFLAAHLGAAAVVALADSVAWALVRPMIDGTAMPWERALAYTLLTNVTWYTAVVAVAEAADAAARARERERAAAALERTAEALRARLDEARLRALESQLQPHFLYNTLNLIAELVHGEPEVADEMLTHLGALLRRSFRDTPHVVPLADEVAFVRAYAGILARRYRDRATLTIDVAPELASHPVPAFLLQPLVENAFRHGVERREGGSVVELTAARHDGALVVAVRDRERPRGRTRARGADRLATRAADVSAVAARGDGGVGLANTRERLALLYGEAGRLTLDRTPHETVATVRIPLDAGHAPSDGDGAVRAPERALVPAASQVTAT